MRSDLRLTAIIALSLSISRTIFALDIIPRPMQANATTGTFTLSAATIIHAGAALREAGFLKGVLKFEYGLTVNVDADTAAATGIALVVSPAQQARLGMEGYALASGKDQVAITGATEAGVFNGIQTLRQLLAGAIGGPQYTVPGVDITDAPRFPWRGMMLDVARHFKTVNEMKRLINELALLKMNTLHLHLSDDQGWRIEIKKYPQLTAVGSTRVPNPATEQNYQGFYTQAQMQDLIAFASARNITLVPEIEVPGHATALIASYPWLGTGKTAVPVSNTYGIQTQVLDISDPKVIGFVEDVLDELMALFPSHSIHIGGDEVAFDNWNASPAMTAFMQSKGLKSGYDAQVWFANLLSQYVASKNRRLEGWNEIMDIKFDHDAPAGFVLTQKLDPNPIVQYWKGDLKRLNEAGANGNDIVDSYNPYLYFTSDMPTTYAYNPAADLDPKYAGHLLGIEACVWSEGITTETQFNAYVYPKLAVYSEMGWTAEANKDYAAFQNGIPFFTAHWDRVEFKDVPPDEVTSTLRVSGKGASPGTPLGNTRVNKRNRQVTPVRGRVLFAGAEGRAPRDASGQSVTPAYKLNQ